MKVNLLVIGKTEDKYLSEGIGIYISRLKHHFKFTLIEIPAIKKTGNMNSHYIREEEAKALLKNIGERDFVILLDEKGEELSSKEFASFFEKKSNMFSTLTFIVGGAFGVHEGVKKRADMIFSLSKLTFSHQMIRLFVVEQLYRVMTILKNHPYHNE